jgi:hypothetical protein
VDREIGGAAPQDELELPGGFVLRRLVDAHAPGLELLDQEDNRLDAVMRGDGSGLTVERAWRWFDHADRTWHWWGLAIGRTARPLPLSVTFTGRKPRYSRGNRSAVPGRTIVTPAVVDGLWVAVVPGLQFAVTCRQDAAVSIRHLEPLPVRRVTGETDGVA